MGAITYICLPLALLVVYRLFSPKSSRNFPPGPRPLPILGNILDFPRERPSVAFAKWKDKYGDVSYANFFRAPTLILNSREACVDLLEKRSAIYSDRPRLVMISELMGFDWDMSIMGYSPRWREHRRLFHQFFNENAVLAYHQVQQQSTHALLQRLLHRPEEFLGHLRFAFADSLLRIIYNIKAKDHNDPHIRIAEEAARIGAAALVAGRYLVDIIPILKYVPSWVPGANFKRQAEEWKAVVNNSKDLPARHANSPSVFFAMLDRIREERGTGTNSPESAEDVAKNNAAVAYLASADTTVSSFQTLFMVLANHPEVQEMAHKELDSVVGSHRLPTFKDQQSLVYITAIVKELLRWHAVAPLGLAHTSIQDDEYKGYFIPKGTAVLPNIWQILHDPDIYPDPFTFNPSRWLIDTPMGLRPNEAIPDPDIALFGYGRRSCPARHFAQNSLFIIASNVLACFNISPLDESGNPAERVKEEFADRFLLYPLPFKVSISPRSEAARRLVEGSVV